MRNNSVISIGGRFAILADEGDSEPLTPSKSIKAYLLERDELFQKLDKLRGAGWKNPEGDKHFAKQRSVADNAQGSSKQEFYDMMIRIGKEMNCSTGAMNVPSRTLAGRDPVIIDLCMAPGGFSASTLHFNPTAKIYGLSLPMELGGWEILFPREEATALMYQDMTMLAADMGVSPTDVPPNHPDLNNFMHARPFLLVQADIIFCGGGVQRLHGPHRAEYRQRTEGTRLAISQLVFALNRLRDGGTLVMLMHRSDNWFTVQLLYTIGKFSNKVHCFKPKAGHQIRSSFYMVAKGVHPSDDACQKAVERWKAVWRRTTFQKEEYSGGNEDGVENDEVDFAISNLRVEKVLEEFGEELIELGRPVWSVQAEALEHANRKWTKQAKREDEWREKECNKKASWR